MGLTEQNIARQVTGWVAALGALDDSVDRLRRQDVRRSGLSRAEVPSAFVSAGTTSVRCHSLAPPSRRKFSIASLTSPLSCQSQHSRRMSSGEARFSVGTCTCADSSESPARAASSRAAASGLRLAQRTAGGGPFCGSAVSGGSGLVRADSSAASQTCALRRCLCPPKIGSFVRSSTVLGSATAAATIAESGRIRPGAMSRRRAI